MDEAKKLLDSLMGQTRNVELKEAKKRKGNNFKEADACKHYLIGFCPQSEQLFRNTKRHLGECSKIHSDALKGEFEAHAEHAEYEAKYVRDLVRYLESIVRTADEAISRQARNIQMANKELEEKGPNDVAKREIEKIRENCNLLLNEAEEMAEAGDIEGSKMKQAIFEQTKQKADEYEAKSMAPIKEEVCPVCGLRPEDGDGMRTFSHTEGKIHQGFEKVREWLEKLREKMKEIEEKNPSLGEKKKDRSRSRGDRRDRRRGEDRDGDRRDRDRRDRDGDKKEEKTEGAEGEAKDKPAESAGADGADDKKDKPESASQADDDKKDQPRDRDRRRGGDDRDRGRGERGEGEWHFDRGGDRERRGDRDDRRGGDRDNRGRGDRGDERGRDRGDRDRRDRDRRY